MGSKRGQCVVLNALIDIKITQNYPKIEK